MSRNWKMILAALAAISLAAWGFAACGDDGATATDGGADSGTDTDTDSDTDTDTDTDADGTLEVLVLSESWTADPAPAEDALVTLDKPGGERVELTAGADGTVVFDAIDWSLGTASATASMDGHGMASHVGLAEADGPLTIRIPVQPVETVTLSGTVTNMTDEANWMQTEAVVPGGGSMMSTGPDYSINVPSGVPFPLYAVEWLWDPPSDQGQGFIVQNWFWQEMDAIAADTTYDVTFEGDGGVESNEVSGSFDFSLTEGSPLSGTAGRGSVFAVVAWWDTYHQWVPGGWMGYGVGFSDGDINADGTAFDYTVEYIEPSSIEHFNTSYMIDSATTQPYPRSVVVEDGLPTAGSHAVDFVDIPVMPSGSPYELNDTPFTWESAETDVYPELIVVVDDYTWIIEGPVGATSLSVPAPPESAALTAQIEAEVFYANLTLTRDAADSTPELWLGAISVTDDFAVQYTP